MNAEIYIVKGGKAASECSDGRFTEQMKALAEHNICVLYKTAVDNNEKSLARAFKESSNDEEGIDLIVVGDAIDKGTKENAEEFFSRFQVKKDNIHELQASLSDDAAPETVMIDLNGNEEPADNEKSQATEKRTFNVYTAMVGGKDGIRMIILPKAESIGDDFSSMVYNAVYSVCVENKPKKGRFFRNIIPMKGDKPLEIVRKSVLIVAILTFIVSGYLLVDQLIIKPVIADNTNNEIKGLLSEAGGENIADDDYNAVAPKKKKIVLGESEILPDFEKLLNTNKDTVGWIKIPNTQINYVVCQSQDPEQPEFYLKHDFYGNYSDYGTIFLDYRSPLDAQNLIIHGHHMNDGRMFANLMYYQDIDFYKENPSFTFNTIYEKAKWKIISVYKTNTLEEQGEFFNYLRGTFETESDFMNYIYQIRERSIFDCPVDVNEDDTLVTLSTCCYDFDQFRFVVVARRVREGETAKVNTSKAKMNDNPVYPECWYKSHGGTRPTLTSFEEALEAGEISWYNNPHKKNWKVSKAQKEATAKIKKEKEEQSKAEENSRKAEESSRKAEESSRKAAEASQKLEDANTQLSTANDYLNIAKENLDALKEIYSDITEASETARKDSITSVSNARKNIYKSKTEKELKNIINDLEKTKSENTNIKSEIKALPEWEKVITRQLESAIEYADAALEYTSDVKDKVKKIKDTANKYKEELGKIMTGSETLSAKADERNELIDAQITNANNMIKKLKDEESKADEQSAESSEQQEPTDSQLAAAA